MSERKKAWPLGFNGKQGFQPDGSFRMSRYCSVYAVNLTPYEKPKLTTRPTPAQRDKRRKR